MMRILILTVGLTAVLHAAAAAPITYQGQLQQADGPFNGVVDMEFQLYDAPEGGNPEGNAVAVAGVPVDGGLFQVELDFGDSVPFEQGLWLQVSVAGEDLAPRQPITAAPLALRTLSGNDGSVWTVSGASISYTDGPVSIGAFSGPARLNVRSNTGQPPLMARVGDDEVLRVTERGRVGIGRENPSALLHVDASSHFNTRAFQVNNSGEELLRVGGNTLDIRAHTFVDSSVDFYLLGPLYALDVLVLEASQFQQSAVPLCIRATGQGLVGRCASSSARYKKDIAELDTADDLLARMRTVSFRWRETGEEDIGLIAEEVAEIEPRLVFHDEDGEIVGIKYNHLTAILVKALQEQRARTASKFAAQRVEHENALAARDAEIAALRSELDHQRAETAQRLAALEALLIDPLQFAGEQ